VARGGSGGRPKCDRWLQGATTNNRKVRMIGLQKERKTGKKRKKTKIENSVERIEPHISDSEVMAYGGSKREKNLSLRFEKIGVKVIYQANRAKILIRIGMCVQPVRGSEKLDHPSLGKAKTSWREKIQGPIIRVNS